MPHLSPLAMWRVALGILISTLVPETVALRRPVARTLGANGTADPGQVLSVPLRRVEHRGIATPSLAKRLFKTDLLVEYGAAYLAELEIGTTEYFTKKQVVDVLIDTGSFELWVNPVCSSSNLPELCAAFGHYDPEVSRTSRRLDGEFTITYGSGSVSGDYYMDDVYISGVKIESQKFGVATSSDLVWFGIMGLGNGQESGITNHPLVIDSLAAQGLTNTKLFSLDLGGQIMPGGAATGEMVFGGVDTNKYAGFLKKVPTDPSDPHYKVTLDSISHRAPGSIFSRPFMDSNLPIQVIIDSGTTLSLLPLSIVSKLAAQFPGALPDGRGGYRVDCGYQAQDGFVDFRFGSVTISVAYRDFIWNSGGTCFLGAWYAKDPGVWILGDTFLRGAYVTFDQTNHALFMANYAPCNGRRSKLVAVPAGPDAAGRIPGACPEMALPYPSWTWPFQSTVAASPSLQHESTITAIGEARGTRTVFTTVCSHSDSMSSGRIQTDEEGKQTGSGHATKTITSTLTHTIAITTATSMASVATSSASTAVATASSACLASDPDCVPQAQITASLETSSSPFRTSHNINDMIAIPNKPTNTAILQIAPLNVIPLSSAIPQSFLPPNSMSSTITNSVSSAVPESSRIPSNTPIFQIAPTQDTIIPTPAGAVFATTTLSNMTATRIVTFKETVRVQTLSPSQRNLTTNVNSTSVTPFVLVAGAGKMGVQGGVLAVVFWGFLAVL